MTRSYTIPLRPLSLQPMFKVGRRNKGAQIFRSKYTKTGLNPPSLHTLELTVEAKPQGYEFPENHHNRACGTRIPAGEAIINLNSGTET